jgi:hypothetical protein
MESGVKGGKPKLRACGRGMEAMKTIIMLVQKFAS